MFKTLFFFGEGGGRQLTAFMQRDVAMGNEMANSVESCLPVSAVLNLGEAAHQLLIATEPS